MDLVPLEDPLDDTMLAKFLDETEKQLTNTAQAPALQTKPAISTSVVNNTVNNAQKMGIPMMYFPQSTVTINYNFHN